MTANPKPTPQLQRQLYEMVRSKTDFSGCVSDFDFESRWQDGIASVALDLLQERDALKDKLDAAEAELEKVKDSRATMALQNASLLTGLDQVILDREAAEARVKAVTAEGIELVKKALGCLVVWRCVVCHHDLHEMPISPSGPCPKCGKSSHFHGLFSDDREGLVALLRAADAAKEE